MQSHTSRDTFLYLLQFVVLAIASTALGNVWFALINRWTASPAGVGEVFYPQAITGGLSALVVAAPVYLGLSWWIRRSFTNQTMDPGRALRKWLIYFTIFLTAIVGIVDLIAVLQVYLNGDFTLRFFLKALSILIIAGSIFSFYLWDIRRERPVSSSITRTVLGATIGVVLATVIAGFWVVGSPKTRRLLAWDSQRVESLRTIAQDIVYRVSDPQQKRTLPNDQAQFEQNFSYLPLDDPQTNQSYEYRRLSDVKFELCATFALDAEYRTMPKQPRLAPIIEKAPPLDFGPLEQHPSGRQCFQYKTNIE
ncbi:hypothetical protein HZA86_01220 [Candidatus Uhrbacteria bacterium]|nr:hypothetical protein [Candidatus Uhrbacteria bacterium]